MQDLGKVIWTLQHLAHCLGFGDGETWMRWQKCPDVWPVVRSMLCSWSWFSAFLPKHSDYLVLWTTPQRRSHSRSSVIFPTRVNSLLLIPSQPNRPKLQWTDLGVRPKAYSANLRLQFLGANDRLQTSVRKSFISPNPGASPLKPEERADEKSIVFDCKPVKMIGTVVH